jgi:membrane protein DedA with SNARE-associated domain
MKRGKKKGRVTDPPYLALKSKLAFPVSCFAFVVEVRSNEFSPGMFHTLLDYFQGSALSLWGPFLILILCGLGLPVPEDIVLVAAGALGVIEERPWLQVSAVMYGGVMAGDSIVFLAGRHLGWRLLDSKWFQRLLPPAKQSRVRDLFDKYGSFVLFVGRFLPGLRSPIFLTAGSMKVRYWKFFLFDGLAALISVPVFVWLGHWLWLEFGEDLSELNRMIHRTHSLGLLMALTIVVLGLLVLWYQVRRKRAAKASDV